MAKQNSPIVAFNGGEIGREVVNRSTIENYPNTASLVQNWLTEVAGPMTFRMGFEYKGAIPGHPEARLRRFTFSADQTNMLVLTEKMLRIADNNGNFLVRNAVGATVANPAFDVLGGWTDISAPGASIAILNPGIRLTSNGSAVAGVRQQIATTTQDIRHSLVIEVARGPVYFRVGTASGEDDIVAEQMLRKGTHSIAFTPGAATFFIEISSTDNARRQVASVAFADAGDITLPTPWTAAQMHSLRFQQSTDVLYIGTGIGPLLRLERRGVNSWSIVEANITDGPFLPINTDKRIAIQPTGIAGNVSLIASRNIFKPGHVGALWKLIHTGQNVAATVSGPDQWSDSIKVTGVGSDRTWSYTIAGTFTGTIRVRRSIGNETNWQMIASPAPTAPETNNYNDGFDNQTVYYQMGFGSSGYTSGSADISLAFSAGTTTGVARVTDVVSPTEVGIEVLQTFGQTTPSVQWYEGAWSDARYWPRGVCIDDGRLVAGSVADLFWASASNAYESFATGDQASDAISRAIATGDMNRIMWMVSLERLLTGTAGAVAMIRASQLDEVITPTNLTVKDTDTLGVADVEPAKIDQQALFVGRDKWRAYEVRQNDRGGYSVRGLMRLNRRLGKPGIVQIAMQREPDARAYFVRADGVCLVLLYDTAENAIGWGRIVTDGAIESVEVLPGEGEDKVFAWIRRTVNGQTVRYFEKLDNPYVERMTDANPVDSYVRYVGAPTQVLAGLSHLEGKVVVAWADGYYAGEHTVADGKITLRKAASVIVAGLYYEGLYQSSKLLYAAQAGTAQAQLRRPLRVAFMLDNYKPGALEYGVNFVEMDKLSDRFVSTSYDAASDIMAADTESFPMPGGFDRDPRLCLRATSKGGPVTVSGLVLGMATNDKVG